MAGILPWHKAMYRLGKTPARIDSIKLKLSTYATLPTPPTKYGHEGLVNLPWQILGNDKYGDCVWAGADHETMLFNKEAGVDINFSDQTALSDYSACTGFNPNDPNTDQGTDMQVAASYRLKTGIVDSSGVRHKVGAYLAITPGNKEELKQAISTFSNVGIGIQFPASAMDQFNEGKNWTVVKNSQIEGGHYIPAVGYDSRYVYIVTWGKLIKASWGFIMKYCDEAVVYLSPEMLTGGVSLDGFNLTQLQTDLKELT